MSIDSKSITAKNFHIVQYVKHPISGETLITLDQIDDGLNHKSIKRYAFIMLDKDTYTEEDFLKDIQKETTKKQKPKDFLTEIKETETADLELILQDQRDLYSEEEIVIIEKELSTRKDNI